MDITALIKQADATSEELRRLRRLGVPSDAVDQKRDELIDTHVMIAALVLNSVDTAAAVIRAYAEDDCVTVEAWDKVRGELREVVQWMAWESGRWVRGRAAQPR